MDDRAKNYYDLAYCRKSVREYADKKIEDDKLNRVMEMAHRAPSAANRQPCHYIIIKKENNQEFFRQAITKQELQSAPVLIAVCVEPDKGWVRQADEVNFAWVDAAIGATEVITAATAEGLGTCWVASFDLKKARDILGIPKECDLVTLLAIGYPQSPLTLIETKQRKPLDSIVHYEKW